MGEEPFSLEPVADSGWQLAEFVPTLLGLVVASLFLWVVVRAINRREKWATRAGIGLLPGASLLYVAVFGPSCWLADRRVIPDHVVAAVYSPFLDIAFQPYERPGRVASALNWWADACSRRNGAARRIVCRKAAAFFHCGSISGCDEDDFDE